MTQPELILRLVEMLLISEKEKSILQAKVEEDQKGKD